MKSILFVKINIFIYKVENIGWLCRVIYCRMESSTVKYDNVVFITLNGI